MSRTTLCTLTAAALAALALTTMALRYGVLGEEARRPIGPGTWKVTLAVQGSSQGNARLQTAVPLELERQHVQDCAYHSEQLSSKAPNARHPGRRRVLWAQRPGAPDGAFKARAEFYVQLEVERPAGGGVRQTDGLYAGPRKGEYLGAEALIEPNDERVSALARSLTAGLGEGPNQLDVAQALFRFVEQKVKSDVRFGGPAVSARACLDAGRGDRSAKSRLLAALLRNRNIPARVVTGLALAQGAEQQAHYWVEAYVYDHWLPLCPFHHHFGWVPASYLVLGFGDRPPVAGKRVAGLQSAFLVQRLKHEGPGGAAESVWRRGFKAVSLYRLPPPDRRLVEVLLLLPLAALIICVFRNVIGLHSFGTFAPALIGLAFHHELNSLPGFLVFVGILLAGWLMRRLLDSYHLLQVPRVSLMLTLIMSLLIGLIVVAHRFEAPTTRYISLFPMVILTGMVERFWALETEDSTVASFKTLLQTMFIAAVIAVVLSWPWLVQHLFCFPEALGLVMAAQLLIGRYTGYRLTELFRFRDFLRQPPALDGRPAEA
jgi:hypothetical protein